MKHRTKRRLRVAITSLVIGVVLVIMGTAVALATGQGNPGWFTDPPCAEGAKGLPDVDTYGPVTHYIAGVAVDVSWYTTGTGQDKLRHYTITAGSGHVFVKIGNDGYEFWGPGTLNVDHKNAISHISVCPPESTTTTTLAPQYGALEIYKAFGGDSVPAAAQSDFTITVTGPNGSSVVVWQGPFPASGHITVTSLVPGTYAVDESNPANPPWINVTGEGNVSVVANQTGSVTITNYGSTTSTTAPPQYGSLEIYKAFSAPGMTTNPANFSIVVTGPDGPTQVWQGSFPANGDPVTLTSLVPGLYNVSEDTPGDTLTWWAVTGEGGVVVPANQTPTVTITNYGSTSTTSTTVPQYGSLEIYKAFDAPGMTTDPGDFSIVVTGPDGPAVVWQGSFAANGDPVTLTSLVPGLYDVNEDTPGDTLTWWAVTGEGGVVVPANQTPTVTLTNYGSTTTTAPWGCLEVTKQVTGDPPAGWSYGQFVITVSGPAGEDSTTTSLAFDRLGKILLCGLAPGTYTITEADPGTAWEVLYPEGQTVVVSTSTTVQRTVINDPTTTSTTTGGSTTSASVTSTTTGGSTTSASVTSTTTGGSTTSASVTSTTTGGSTTTKKVTSTTVKGYISTPEGIQTGGGGMADAGKWVWVVMALAGVVFTGAGASYLRPRRSTR